MSFDCPPWPPQWPEIDAAIDRIVSSGDWGRYHSAACQQLQERLGGHFQAHARLCCSGTAALEIALRALRIGGGDEVIVAAYDYPGNFRTIELLGARPVLVDVRPDSPTMDPGQLEAAASDRVRAVVASHLYGESADIRAIADLCDQHGWTLIEDACQVAGMEIEDRPAGSWGHLATLSFGGSKLVSAGSGGALLVQSDQIAARLGPLLERPGDTFALSPLQAAVIGPQLDRLEELNQIRAQPVTFLRHAVSPRLNRWQMVGGQQEHVVPAYYKVAWQAESSADRQRCIDAAQAASVPLGAGFRSMSRCSVRRCRKPVRTPNADRLGETAMLLDHAALLLEPSRHPELAECLVDLHDQNQ